ncbi:MAG: hypothetical protein OXC44_01710 [Proteobacteria bacterium]|nr:hypothetical protein [Pseudomonadota bacterium]
MNHMHRIAITWWMIGLIMASPFIYSSTAYGFIKGGVSYGFGQKAKITASHQSLNSLENKNIPISTWKISALGFLPLPTDILSVGLGLTGGHETFQLQTQVAAFTGFDGKKQTGNLNTMSSWFAGPGLFLGVKFPGFFIGPYGRLSYIFATNTLKASLNNESSNNTSEFTVPLTGRGWRYSAGLEIHPPIPFLTFFVEHEWGQDKVGLSDSLSLVKQASQNISDKSVSDAAQKALYKVSDQIQVENLDFQVARRGFLVGVKFGF